MVQSLKGSFIAAGIVAFAMTCFAQDEPDRYIVVFADQAKDSRLSVNALRQSLPVNVDRMYDRAIRGFVFRGDPQAAQVMARRSDVAYVVPDTRVYAVQQTIPTGLTRSKVNDTISINGQSDDLVDGNVKVAIIDTGLDIDHPDLNIYGGIRFFLQLPFIVSDGNFDDDHGHGTHVGGTVGAIDNGFGAVGVAPGVPLYGVKVLNASGIGYTSVIIAGIDHLIALNADSDPSNDIQVANMSLRGEFNQAFNDAVSNAAQQGIVMVVAAGNDSADVAAYSPGSEPDAITVSALVDTNGTHGGGGNSTSAGGDDYFANFSNFGPLIDICAPGVFILSTRRGGGYGLSSGTSMAAPHIAGAAALYIANHSDPFGGNTGLDAVNAIRQALIDSAWGSDDEEYMLGGDTDGIPEPLLNVGGLKSTFGSLNTAPAVTILTPVDEANNDEKTSISFVGSATDLEEEDLSSALVWTSDLDGPIGSGAAFFSLLSVGTHLITASVSDTGTPVLNDIDAVTITVDENLSYDEWIELKFPTQTDPTIIGQLADPDGDFITNLEEFGHGLNPDVPDASGVELDGLTLTTPGLPVVINASETGGVELRAIFLRRKHSAAIGLNYTTYFSGDLSGWHNPGGSPTLLNTAGELELVSVTFPSAPLPDGTNPIACRVEVELVSP